MDVETDFFGRKYYCIPKAINDYLLALRQNCFEGIIDANTCQTESYKVLIEKDYVHPQNIYFLVKRNPAFDVCFMWVVNSKAKTVHFEGARSLRVAETLKHLSPDSPFLFTKEEYETLIELHFKYYGPYFFRPDNKKIPQSEFKYCQEVIEKYHNQVLEERRMRQPKFGDIVRTLSGSLARYIGKNQALIKENSELKRDLIDMDVDWTANDSILPSDADLIEYIKESNLFI